MDAACKLAAGRAPADKGGPRNARRGSPIGSPATALSLSLSRSARACAAIYALSLVRRVGGMGLSVGVNFSFSGDFGIWDFVISGWHGGTWNRRKCL